MELPLPITYNRKDYILQRTFEIIPGALTWLTFILMIALSIWKPIWIAVFIIAFDCYWITKGLFVVILTVNGYNRMKLNISVNWLDRCKGISGDFDEYYKGKKRELKKFDQQVKQGKNPNYFKIENSNLVRFREKVSLKKQRKIMDVYLKDLAEINKDEEKKKNILNWQEVEHVVILPTVKEPIEVLRTTLDSLHGTNYPNEKMHIFYGFEEKAILTGDKEVNKRREILQKEYEHKFGHFETTLHPVLEGEKAGKSSNETWIAKRVKQYLDKKGISYDKTMISSFDSDACVHKEYFAAATYYFITTKKRTRCAYQPVPFFSNTIWYAPAYSRIIGLASTFWHIVESIRTERLVTFSNQTHSFRAIVEANYWPVNYVVNDDSVIYWRCYFKYDGDYKTIPLFMPAAQDAVYSGGFWETFKACYLQRQRWAYGVEHFPTVTRAYLSDKEKKIPFFEKFRHIFILLEGNHSWATNPLIIVSLGWLPLFLGGSEFNQSVMSQNLPNVTRTLMTISMVFMVASLYLGYVLVPPKPKNYPWYKNLILIYQWAFVPVMSTVLGAIPAIDAQTRLMIGKYLGFNTTPKKRK